MEIDWELELGGGAEIISAAWPGFCDLSRTPALASALEEVRLFPPLGPALATLNQPGSPFFTTKCDIWPALEAGLWDPYEMDATPENSVAGAGGYIDLIPRTHGWQTPAEAEAACRALTGHLRPLPLACCRVDLIVRQAILANGDSLLAMTAYLTACGPTPQRSLASLTACLSAFAARVANG